MGGIIKEIKDDLFQLHLLNKLENKVVDLKFPKPSKSKSRILWFVTSILQYYIRNSPSTKVQSTEMIF